MRGQRDQADAIGSVAALDDPVRRRLFTFVRSARGPVTREEAAEQVGISRKLAAFHLDKLVTAGLLEAGLDESRPRRVGRAPKAYQPTADALLVSVPRRSYETLAAILLDAARMAEEAPAQPQQEARRQAAHQAGRALGAARRREAAATGAAGDAPLAKVETVLETEGFEPFRAEPGRVRLQNCPFHPLAAHDPEIVCGINHAYLCGVLAGMRLTSLEAELAPEPGQCCVEIARARRRRPSS
jgi:predicted ArsR family transcriptional regulator